MRTLLKLAGLMATVVMSLGIGSAQATLVNFTLTGEVIYADEDGFGGPGNTYNLLSGDSITVVGTFDDDALLGGSGTISFTSGNIAGNTFTLTAGDITFTPDEEIGLSPYPYMVLNAGTIDFSIDGFTFYATDSVTSATINSNFDFFDGDDTSLGYISGNWLTYTSSPVVVPVPAAVWLLGSGLLGLVGVTRRNASI